jgi:hypothetical protein
MVSHDRLAAGFHGGSPAPTGPRIAASGEVALRISGKPDDALGCGWWTLAQERRGSAARTSFLRQQSALLRRSRADRSL